MGPLNGKVALVTGSSRGIGRAIALELARAGAKVAVNYRSGEAQAREVAQEIAAMRAGSALSLRQGETQARALADEISTRVGTVTLTESQNAGTEAAAGENVMVIQSDISSSAEARAMVTKVVEKWGRIDILVNNAGITRDRTLRKLGEEDWLAVINTNLNGVFFTTTAALQVMMEQKYGRVVNVGSLIGQVGNIGQANYAAAKGGMIAFTKTAALEMAKYNITVNVVNPGFTATEMLMNVPEQVQEQIKAKIPMGRFAKPEEIARAVLFLAADGDYITGQQIDVNGGIRM